MKIFLVSLPPPIWKENLMDVFPVQRAIGFCWYGGPLATVKWSAVAQSCCRWSLPLAPGVACGAHTLQAAVRGRENLKLDKCEFSVHHPGIVNMGGSWIPISGHHLTERINLNSCLFAVYSAKLWGKHKRGCSCLLPSPPSLPELQQNSQVGIWCISPTLRVREDKIAFFLSYTLEVLHHYLQESECCCFPLRNRIILTLW